MKEEINIILAADNPYSQHLAVTLESLLDNFSAENYKLIIHILDGGLSPDNKEKIKTLGTGEKSELLFHKIDEDLFSDFPEPGHLKMPTYFRLIIPKIIDQKIKKLLYLDSDLVIVGNILDLYLENINDFIFGAVRDAGETSILKEPYQIPIKNFFNAGILLINLNLWREYKISEQATEFIKNNYHKLKGADQDALNYVLQNLPWRELNRKYNVQLKRNQEEIKNEELIILHFVGPLKPWHYLSINYYQKYYFDYLDKTPWKNNYYTDFSYYKFIQKIFKNIPVIRKLRHYILKAIQRV